MVGDAAAAADGRGPLGRIAVDAAAAVGRFVTARAPPYVPFAVEY